MVSLLFRQRSDTIHEFQSLLEVRKLEVALKVMFICNRPAADALVQLFQVLSFQRRNSSAARYALLVGKLLTHDVTPFFQNHIVNVRSAAFQPAPAVRTSTGCVGDGALK